MSWFDEFEREMRRLRRIIERIPLEIEREISIWTRPRIFLRPWRRARIYREMPKYEEPTYDLKEEADKIVTTIDMAGVSKENIEVYATKDELEVKGKFPEDIAEMRGFEGYYLRRLLPADIDPKGTKSTYRNGVLTITMPKAKVPKGERISVE